VLVSVTCSVNFFCFDLKLRWIRITTKVPTFNRDVKNFMLWFLRFQAFAVMKKFIGAIQVAGDADLSVEEKPRKKNKH
jgi:hypothetical protein